MPHKYADFVVVQSWETPCFDNRFGKLVIRDAVFKQYCEPTTEVQDVIYLADMEYWVIISELITQDIFIPRSNKNLPVGEMPRCLSLHTASALPPGAEQGLGRAPESIAGDPGCRGLPRGPKKTQRQLRLRMDTKYSLTYMALLYKTRTNITILKPSTSPHSFIKSSIIQPLSSETLYNSVEFSQVY